MFLQDYRPTQPLTNPPRPTQPPRLTSPPRPMNPPLMNPPRPNFGGWDNPTVPRVPDPMLPDPRVRPSGPVTPPTQYAPPVDTNDPTSGTSRINEDYGPGSDPRLAAARTRTDAAVPSSARTTAYGTAQDMALAALTGGPNRTALARQTLADLEQQGALGLQQRFRNVGQTAAALGRTGAGMTTNDLTGLEATYTRDLAQRRNELASSVAEGDIGDRYRTVSAAQGARGQEADIDAQRLAAAGSLEDRIYGQGQVGRDEQRTERAYQQGNAQRTIENRLAQRRAEDAAEQLRIRRALASGGLGNYGPQAAWEG